MKKSEMTLVDMFEANAAERPDKTALIYKSMTFCYRELNDLVDRIAGGMVSHGIKKGDRIGLMLERRPELFIAFMASEKIGAIPTPVNYNLTGNQISHLLFSIKPCLIFTDKKFVSLLKDIEGFITVVIDGGDCRHISWEDLQKSTPLDREEKISGEDIAYLNFTSGSTGEQKGAMATHNNIYWNTLSAVETFNITEADIHLCMFASFAHPHELFARALFTGGTMALLDEIFPKSLVRTIKDNRVTCMMGLAPMFELLLDVAKKGDLDTLRIPESGGMFTNPELIKKFEKKSGVPIYPVWGSTETTGVAIANRPGQKNREASIGRPCSYYDVKVVNDDGQEVKTGEVGELVFKGAAVVNGYYGIEDEKSSCFDNGWYHSGDLGKTDEDGFFYFVDRKSAMMKVAGLKVYPLEVEKALAAHPMVKDVAVIGTEDRLKGEVPKAVIVPYNDHGISTGEIRSFCKGRLANYMIPRIIEFRDELPRSGSGKIDKKALAEECR